MEITNKVKIPKLDNLENLKASLADKYIGICDACHKRFGENDERIEFGGIICKACYQEVGDIQSANKIN